MGLLFVLTVLLFTGYIYCASQLKKDHFGFPFTNDQLALETAVSKILTQYSFSENIPSCPNHYREFLYNNIGAWRPKTLGEFIITSISAKDETSVIYDGIHSPTGQRISIKLFHKSFAKNHILFNNELCSYFVLTRKHGHRRCSNYVQPILTILSNDELRMDESMHGYELPPTQLPLIVFERLYMTLDEYMELQFSGHPEESVEETQSRRVMAFQEIIPRVLDCIAFLHDNNMIHMSVVPEHVHLIIDETTGYITRLVLGSFSWCKKSSCDILPCDDPLYYLVDKFSPYISPEIFFLRGYSIQTDLWSVGVLSLVILGHPRFILDNVDPLLLMAIDHRKHAVSDFYCFDVSFYYSTPTIIMLDFLIKLRGWGCFLPYHHRDGYALDIPIPNNLEPIGLFNYHMLFLFPNNPSYSKAFESVIMSFVSSTCPSALKSVSNLLEYNQQRRIPAANMLMYDPWVKPFMTMKQLATSASGLHCSTNRYVSSQPLYEQPEYKDNNPDESASDSSDSIHSLVTKMIDFLNLDQ